jgi:hypothetical protein
MYYVTINNFHFFGGGVDECILCLRFAQQKYRLSTKFRPNLVTLAKFRPNLVTLSVPISRMDRPVNPTGLARAFKVGGKKLSLGIQLLARLDMETLLQVSSTAYQGCQIFLITCTKTGSIIIPNDTNCAKWL